MPVESVSSDFVSVDSGFFEKTKDSLDSLISEKAKATFRTLSSACSKAKTSVNFFSLIYPQVEALFELVQNTASIAGEFFTKVKDVAAKIRDIKIISILAAPFKVYNLAQNIKALAEGILNKIPDKVADSVLDIIESAAEITTFISLFVVNPTLTVATGFFSAISVIIQGKQLFHSVRFHRELKERKGDLTEVSDYDLEKRLDVDVDLLRKADCTDEGMKKLIHKRSIQKIISHALQMTASVISVIAAAILITVPPIAPVCFGLWGLVSLISIADFIADKVVENQLTKALKAQSLR